MKTLIWILAGASLFLAGVLTGYRGLGPGAKNPDPRAQVTNTPGPSQAPARASTTNPPVSNVHRTLALLADPTIELEVAPVLLSRSLQHISLDELPAVLAAIERIPFANKRKALLQSLLIRWGELDHEPALTYAKGILPPAHSREAIASVLKGWSQRDAAAASQWVAVLPDGPLRSLAISEVLSSLVQTPDRALQWLQQIDPKGTHFYLAHNVFLSWAQKDPKEAAAVALSLTSERLKDQALSSLAWQWGQEDPAAAVAWVRSLPENLRRRLLPSTILSWGSVDGPNAMKFVEGLPDGSQREELMAGVAGQWTEQDPAGALRWLESAAPRLSRSSLWTTMVPMLVSQNPWAAIDYANRVTEPAERKELLEQIARSWSERDPESAVAWARQLPDPKLRRDMESLLAWSLPGSDPDLAGLLAAGFPESPKRSRLVAEIAANLAQRDINRAMEYLNTLSSNDRRLAEQQVILARLGEDPAAAAKMAEALPPNIAGTRIMEMIASTWANTDLQSALNWSTALPGEKKNSALKGLSETWARQNPSAAFTYATGLQEGELREGFLQRIFAVWSERNPNEAVDAFRRLQLGESRTQALISMVAAWSPRAPARAAEFVAGLEPGEPQNRAALQVLSEWSRSDPVAAANWVNQFPEGDLRAQGLENLASNWATDDPATASEFLNRLPPGPSRDAAYAAFAGSVAAQNPELGARYAASISNPDQQLQAIASVATAWTETDKAKLESWLNALPLTIEQRTAVLQQAAANAPYLPETEVAPW